MAIAYQVAMENPQHHFYQVTLQITGWQRDRLDLKFPVWTPGSYLVREYAKNLQEFRVFDGNSKTLEYRKESKNHWQIHTQGISEIVVSYRIYANELTVRTSHLDRSHGYFNGACLFFRVVELEECPIRVAISVPNPAWKISTALPLVPGETATFTASNFDRLVDSPFEIGTHQIYEFEALEKPHELLVWGESGEGNLPVEQTIADIRKIINVEAKMFGGLPYDRYLFLLHLTNKRGGLEHDDCCSLIFPKFGFRERESYCGFMQLVAHEFFHLWNVRRLRPVGLESYDYDRENYTPSLWFCEGGTSYYDLLIPLRAGIYDAPYFLGELGKEITRYQNTPGKDIQPLNESSFDAWIKLYRSDANSANTQMSYYLKGSLVCLMLDLIIRARHNNQRSLDNVMQQMWEKFGQNSIGYTPQQLQEAIESVAGISLQEFWELTLNTTKDLPLNESLEPFGLQLKAQVKIATTCYLGLTARNDRGSSWVKFVAAGSPAHQAGIDPGDELLALNGIRVTAEQLSDRLKDYHPGDKITLTLFHSDRLLDVSVTLAPPKPDRYTLSPTDNPSPTQRQNLEGWLGISWNAAFGS